MIHKRFQPCGLCGVSVPHRYSTSLGWHPAEYHDCKPGERLAAAKADIAMLNAKQKDLTEQLSKARSNVDRMRCNDALLCAVNRVLDASPVGGARCWEYIPGKVEVLVAALAAAKQTTDSLIGPSGRTYVTKVESERNQERTEKAAAVVLLREGLDTGRHCCSERADCPRCAWEEKVRSLLDDIREHRRMTPADFAELCDVGPKPAVEKHCVVLPVNAQKRYLLPHSNGVWFQSDSPNGPWDLVALDPRQASWEKHGGVGQVPPDSELESQGFPPVPT